MIGIDWTEYSDLIEQARNGVQIMSEEERRTADSYARAQQAEEQRIDRRLCRRMTWKDMKDYRFVFRKDKA